MSNILIKGDETVTVKDRYLNKFLSQGWVLASEPAQKKVSKNVIKASADVIEAGASEEVSPLSLTPNTSKGE
jgi:hypothetical protein